MSSDYAHVQKGSLKLKNVSESIVIKKKKKKSKDKEKLQKKMENFSSISSTNTEQEGEGSSKSHKVSTRTKSEIAFENAKQKRMIEEMMQKPLKSHKERIMEFNRNLDNLSEHYDIPKVSWTK